MTTPIKRSGGGSDGVSTGASGSGISGCGSGSTEVSMTGAVRDGVKSGSSRVAFRPSRSRPASGLGLVEGEVDGSASGGISLAGTDRMSGKTSAGIPRPAERRLARHRLAIHPLPGAISGAVDPATLPVTMSASRNDPAFTRSPPNTRQPP
jgi:hypothetical protein